MLRKLTHKNTHIYNEMYKCKMNERTGAETDLHLKRHTHQHKRKTNEGTDAETDC